MKDMRLSDYLVGEKYPPFVIAEMSGNHNGSIEQAKKIISAAAEAGAHAVKFQTYTADTMTLNLQKPGFVIDDSKVFGTEDHYTICMMKHIRRGSGTKNFFHMLKH